jgi:hypothetical protein
MAEERKSILLRIPPELWEQIAAMAQQELRSTNAQMEFLLREAVRARGRKVSEQSEAKESGGEAPGGA